MLSGGDKKYDIGSDLLPPFEMNFVLRATLNFMNGPLRVMLNIMKQTKIIT